MILQYFFFISFKELYIFIISGKYLTVSLPFYRYFPPIKGFFKILLIHIPQIFFPKKLWNTTFFFPAPVDKSCISGYNGIYQILRFSQINKMEAQQMFNTIKKYLAYTVTSVGMLLFSIQPALAAVNPATGDTSGTTKTIMTVAVIISAILIVAVLVLSAKKKKK